ncbi:MAG: YggS family pyridoxal phosphate-dependent enzyme [Hydrogenophilales bacterium]|nr:YggS family pyridoxal phosphate-dependent enzyme [Hydrogenophilales bacterium]
MTTISNALQAVRERIARAAAQCGRQPASIALLAVSKTFGPDAIRVAYAAGQRAFGESYAQEALPKIAALSGLDIEWHFIGPLQSNKTKPIAQHFAWVHGVERAKIAQRLSEQRPPGLPPLNICLQVNVSGEASKSGVAPAQVAALARTVAALPRIKLRGLMAIPAPAEDVARQRAAFRAVRELFEQLNAQGFTLDTLSMGMSSDLEAAIQEGATIVRVGSAIFGERRNPL